MKTGSSATHSVLRCISLKSVKYLKVVLTDVLLQVCTLRKCLSTSETFEWLLSCVDPLMDLE